MKTKKLTIIALLLCAFVAGMKAQTVTVTDVEALPGETVAFTLNLSDGKADTYIALQFDAQFPSSGFTTTGDYTVSPSWKNATSVVGSVDANGLATIPVSSSETISAADVEGLLSVNFTVGSNVALGDYEVTLKRIWFGYGTSNKDYLDDVTFTVSVVDHHTIVLDESSTTAPAAETGVDVRVKRTIKANEWSTLCLPFGMTSAQVKAAFGEDVQLADFTGIESETDVEENVVGINVKFVSATSIEANHPCLIRVSSPIEEFTVGGVDIDPEEEPSVDRDEYSYKVGKKTFYMYNSFVGTYVAGTTVPNEGLFLSANKFWYSTGATTMKAFRGYFDFYEVLTAVDEELGEGAKVRFSIDGEATGIREMENVKCQIDTDWYTLDGRKLHGKPVEKGVYIVNGKKVMIK